MDTRAGATAGNWCTIESDPGVFTELIEEIGVKDVQVEEIYELDKGTIEQMKPVHGLIFLFKWRAGEKDDRPVVDDPDVFFASQVINNACATQAILSILLNREGIDIGDELRQFKLFTQDFPPELKGLAVSNSELIRKAHNSFARAEPFVSSGEQKVDEEEDVYHFISYVPHSNKLYELDGLKQGPILLGDCADDDWLEKVFPVVQKRIEKYSRSEIRFNLMAIIRSRSKVLEEEIQQLKVDHARLQDRLRDLESGDVMQIQSDPLSNVVSVRSKVNDLQHRLQEKEQALQQENEKLKNWQVENIRRKHNYIPFLVNLLRILAEKGQLVPLIQAAQKKT